ncbi:MAG TPA: hypothetical protein VNH13_07205 [Candidatus Acidoferrales bacterium]|nr:hypothetical protein [Candidatus Acidoferrales bacterium]
MDGSPIAEALPELYRRVLDRVADLEQAGFRREADLVRKSATSAYARLWNDRTTRHLERLADRAVRVLDGRERARRRRPGRSGMLATWLPWRAATRRRILATVRARARHAPSGSPLTPEQPAA